MLTKMIEKIAYREGLGDLLSNGSYFTAKKIGKGAEQCAMEVHGQEVSIGWILAPMMWPMLITTGIWQV